jgi:plastocyanin
MKTSNFILTLLVCGCLAATAKAQSAGEYTVVQKDKDFSTTELTIKPGEKITFKNEDSVTHNVFSVSPANPFTIKVQTPGQSSSVDFTQEGVTEVRCAIHPKMKIIVTVKK